MGWLVSEGFAELAEIGFGKACFENSQNVRENHVSFLPVVVGECCGDFLELLGCLAGDLGGESVHFVVSVGGVVACHAPSISTPIYPVNKKKRNFFWPISAGF